MQHQGPYSSHAWYDEPHCLARPLFHVERHLHGCVSYLADIEVSAPPELQNDWAHSPPHSPRGAPPINTTKAQHAPYPRHTPASRCMDT